MKLQPLYDLQQELNRLFVAGSRFAKNDPRLKKQLTVFEKLGEKAPVFKKIASNIDELCKSDEKESSEKLTALSQLLYAVLYTQGESTEENKEINIQTPSLGYTKLGVDLNYRQLSSIAKALTESGSGRMEVLEDALKYKTINNYRLFRYLDNALGDRYGELAKFVAEKIMPEIGESILPILLDSFDYKNTVEEQRRLCIIAKLNPAEFSAISAKILEERIPLLTTELLKHIPKTIDNEELFISLTKEKNRDLRSEAEMALSKVNSKSGWDYLVNSFISTKNIDNIKSLSCVFFYKPMPLEYIPVLTKKLNDVFDDLLNIISESKRDNKKLKEALKKLSLYTSPFIKKEATEAAISLKNIISNVSFCKLAKEGGSLHTVFDFNELAQEITDILIYNKMYDDVEELIESKHLPKPWRDILIKDKFIAFTKRADISPKEIYDQFSEYFKKGVISMVDLYSNSIELMPEGAAIENYLDKRWLPLVEEKIKKRKENNEFETELYVKLAGVESPQVQSLLINILNTPFNYKNKPYYELNFSMAAKFFLLSNYPDKFEIVFQAVIKNLKSIHSFYFKLFDNIGFSKFPKEYAKKFREANVSGKEDLFEYIADIIEEKL